MAKKSEAIKEHINNLSRGKAVIFSPLSLTAMSGDSNGEIDLIWEPVYGARSYVVQRSIKITEPGRWTQEDIITKSSYTVSKLKSGQKYWFRVAAVGSSGQGPWSEPVQKKVP